AGAARPVRGTQLLVEHIGGVVRSPLLLAIEIGWRWLFGIPFLWICWMKWQEILVALPPDSVGYDRIDTMNPWIAIVQLGEIWDQYQPHVWAVVVWLAPMAAVAWAVVSGLGRSAVLRRLEPGVRVRPSVLIVMQGAWLVLLGLTFRVWLACIHWIAATHIAANGEADLVGYSIWAIFVSLGMFTIWALVSWPVTIAPVLALMEDRGPLGALRESFRLGRAFTGKLVEINLVMGIVKMMIVVLAMVFAAAPLPFSDQLGTQALHWISAASVVFYLVANDYFQVVRLKSFVEFWRRYRESYGATANLP
ncbi:MAG TPA: hypothetical protein VGR64_06560, partial [Terracidiphilus sp.]|nr:hypothetical protein [Terracidiphilus sp.]